MKKHVLQTVSLLGYLALANPSMAQNAATQPEFQLPTIMGPVVRPQNASSSTMQLVTGPSGTTENLYIHSWDVYSSYDNNGIAWRRTNAGGSLIAEDYIIIKYASDIDAVIYEDGSDHYVLAAYYFDDGSSLKGHYYDIYRFEPGGLMPVSTMNYLTSSPVFGRINVDATTSGLAIIWCVPGTGIYAKAGVFPGSVFGPDVLMPNTASKVDPDICIRRGGSGSGTGLDLQMVFLENTLTSLLEYRVPFYNVFGGSAAGYTQEYTSSTPTANRIAPPRIDCPDEWNGGQKWAIAMGINNISGTSVTEWIYAVVKNDDWPGVAPTWTFPTTLNLDYVSYTTPWPESNDPVIAYSNNGEQITVGWITKQSTAVIPGTNDIKYVAKDVKDPGTSAPLVIPGSFNMISNIPGSHEPVLAFSGQNLNSNFNGLYTAFAQFNTVFPDYSMMYKSRPWGLSTFKEQTMLNLGEKSEISVSPNPFNNALSFLVPAAGNYSISLTSLDGRVVYSYKDELSQGQLFEVTTQGMASGNYILHITSPENKINKTEKLVKQ